jgi:hypothetical protein
MPPVKEHGSAHRDLTCTSDMDDPHVTRPGVLGWNHVCYPAADNGCIYWGDFEITRPDGTWAGPYAGVDDPVLWSSGTGGAEMIFTMAGSKGYELRTSASPSGQARMATGAAAEPATRPQMRGGRTSARS